MNIQFDFTLNYRWETIDNVIFRLALHGLSNTRQIRDLLWLFSDDVIAGSYQRLVNQQLLIADVSKGEIKIAPHIEALIAKCSTETFDITIPDELQKTKVNGKIIITDRKTKEAIISNLVPNVKLDFLANSLDFCLWEGCDTDG